MLDLAMWLGTTILVLLLELAEAVRAVWEWLQTGPGLVALGVLLVAVWAVVLYGYRRRRRMLAGDGREEGTTTA